MAWQPYVDAMLGGGFVQDAAILGADDGLIWAQSPNFKLSTYDVDVNVDIDKTEKISVNEQATLLEVFKTKGQVSSKAGIRIGGVKYVTTTFDADENAAFLKSDNGGACAVRTNKCILIGTYDTKANPAQTSGNCNNNVAKLAKTLRDAQY